MVPTLSFEIPLSEMGPHVIHVWYKSSTSSQVREEAWHTSILWSEFATHFVIPSMFGHLLHCLLFVYSFALRLPPNDTSSEHSVNKHLDSKEEQ